MSFLENNFFLLAITFGIFFFAKLLQKKTGLVLLNPILLTIALLIIFLKMTNISYETYNKGGHLIEFWLRPAVVALGVPLYLQLEMIKKQLLPILLSQLAGCIVGVISVVLIAKFMGASQEVILSLAPKSVTTPIAMEVTIIQNFFLGIRKRKNHYFPMVSPAFQPFLIFFKYPEIVYKHIPNEFT